MAELTKMQVYLEGANSINQYHLSDGFVLTLEDLRVGDLSGGSWISYKLTKNLTGNKALPLVMY